MRTLLLGNYKHQRTNSVLLLEGNREGVSKELQGSEQPSVVIFNLQRARRVKPSTKPEGKLLQCQEDTRLSGGKWGGFGHTVGFLIWTSTNTGAT